MIEIKLHTEIAAEQENLYCSMLGLEDMVFSLETCQKIFADHPDEKDFKFNIHCPGGVVSEGLAIYDFLRTSGKNIYMNIEGACHSMAVTLLLAAPFENRTANKNCRALIHNVYCEICGYVSADDCRSLADDIERDEVSLINIYTDRTGRSSTELRALMDEQKERTADELLSWGFISKINAYNTNKKNKSMSKLSELTKKVNEFLNLAKKFTVANVNFDFTDADGDVLFSTEGEDDTLEVGMTATPDGTFTLSDGREVIIADGVITEINSPQPDAGDEEVNQLRAENAELRAALASSVNLVTELKSNIKSNHTPASTRFGRTTPPKGEGQTSEERKNEVRGKIHK